MMDEKYYKLLSLARELAFVVGPLKPYTPDAVAVLALTSTSSLPISIYLCSRYKCKGQESWLDTPHVGGWRGA